MQKFMLITFGVVALMQLSLGNMLSPITEENLAKITAGVKRPHDLSGQYQGDMVLTQQQWMLIKGIKPRAGIIDPARRWNGNVLPYIITGNFTEADVELIHESLEHIENATCLRFVEWTTEEDFIVVTGDPTGCWSWVGSVGGPQQLNLQLNGCVHFGIIVHEFIHAIGFFHMQSATERDDYVEIMWENIEPGMESNFDKFSADVITNFGVEYDYGSIMHYDPYGFSINGLPTIVPHDPEAVIGQIDGMSEKDIRRINYMYCPVPA